MLEIERSICALTVVDCVALLFAGVGSGCVAETVPELVIVPPAVGVTVINALNVEPFGMLVQLQETTPDRYEHVPPALAVADTYVDAPGIVFERTTPVACDELKLLTFTLY
jgi:hypothetical protein